MDDNMFNMAPRSVFFNDKYSIFPGSKGILLFDRDGSFKEMYGKEHAMMMQDIGYWYIDNWQNFILNYSYNGFIVVMIEFNTCLVYLPRIISELQKKSLINYIDNNVLENNIQLLNFYMMRCVDENNEKISEIKRNKLGKLKHINGKIINEEKPFNYIQLCNYLKMDNYICKDTDNNSVKIRK